MGFFLSAAAFLRKGGDINVTDRYTKTALHYAVETASVRSLQFLVKEKAGLHTRDAKGNTPLHGAARCEVGKSTLDSLLAPIFDDPSCILDTNEACNTPLHEAASVGNSLVVQALLSHGAVPNARNLDQDTPLHLAARGGYHLTARFLIGSGAERAVRNNDGAISLHLACSGGHGSTVACLLTTSDVDPNIPTLDGNSPAHLAATAKNIGPMQELVRANANINMRDRRWLTPLHLRINAKLGIKFLVASGADIEAKTPSRQTPLHLATMANHVDAAAALVAGGADIKAADLDGKTVLHYAASQHDIGHWLISRMFRGTEEIDVSKQDRMGWTPLHYAAQADNVITFNMLLRVGADADLTVKDRSNCTPIDYAGSTLIESIKGILETKGYKTAMRFINGTMKRVYEAPA